MAHLGVRARHARLADRDIAAEVLARRDRQVAHEVAELRRELHVVVVVVEQPDVGRQHPAAAGLREAGLQFRVALEHAAPDQEGERAVGPPQHFRDVDAHRAHVVRVVRRRPAGAEELLAGRGARVEADHDAERLAGFPERVVTAVVVVRERPRHVRDHRAAQAARVNAAHLAHGLLHVPQQRYRRDAEVPRRILRAQLGEPAVVGARAGPLQLGHDVLGRQAQAGTEGRRVHLGDAVGEDDLPGDAVAVEHADALGVVPGAGELLLDALAPLVVDFLDQEGLLGRLDLLHLQRVRVVEGLAVLRIEVIAIALARQAGVAVGGNDDVAVHSRCS